MQHRSMFTLLELDVSYILWLLLQTHSWSIFIIYSLWVLKGRRSHDLSSGYPVWRRIPAVWCWCPSAVRAVSVLVGINTQCAWHLSSWCVRSLWTPLGFGGRNLVCPSRPVRTAGTEPEPASVAYCVWPSQGPQTEAEPSAESGGGTLNAPPGHRPWMHHRPIGVFQLPLVDCWCWDRLTGCPVPQHHLFQWKHTHVDHGWKPKVRKAN